MLDEEWTARTDNPEVRVPDWEVEHPDGTFAMIENSGVGPDEYPALAGRLSARARLAALAPRMARFIRLCDAFGADGRPAQGQEPLLRELDALCAELRAIGEESRR